LVVLVCVLVVCGLLRAATAQTFDYLNVDGNTVETTHPAKYRFKLSKALKPLGEFHHQPVYEGVRFNVSLAAFAREDRLLMVHAEMHTDQSGGLDYSKLPPAEVRGVRFNMREQCVTLADVRDPYGNPELRFVRDRGFVVLPPLYLRQFYATSPDGTAEVVLTYATRVESCGGDALTAEFKAGVEKELRSAVKSVEAR
jgi:hypothetical protein